MWVRRHKLEHRWRFLLRISLVRFLQTQKSLKRNKKQSRKTGAWALHQQVHSHKSLKVLRMRKLRKFERYVFQFGDLQKVQSYYWIQCVGLLNFSLAQECFVEMACCWFTVLFRKQNQADLGRLIASWWLEQRVKGSSTDNISTTHRSKSKKFGIIVCSLMQCWAERIKQGFFQVYRQLYAPNPFASETDEDIQKYMKEVEAKTPRPSSAADTVERTMSTPPLYENSSPSAGTLYYCRIIV